MEMHIQALFTHDAWSCILAINSWQGGTAPRFFLGRTEQGTIWRFRNDLPEQLCDKLTVLCQRESVTISERPKYETEYIRLLAENAPIKQIWLGPAYWFANGAAIVEETVLINEQNAHLLQGGFDDWLPDIPHQQPIVAMLVGGRAVALCASVRISKFAHEAGVETVPSQRRKGYAVKVVSGWANAVAKLGVQPLYSTSIENLASQNVTNRLGLSKFGVDFHIT